jgi:hypothetical protein
MNHVLPLTLLLFPSRHLVASYRILGSYHPDVPGGCIFWQCSTSSTSRLKKIVTMYLGTAALHLNENKAEVTACHQTVDGDLVGRSLKIIEKKLCRRTF